MMSGGISSSSTCSSSLRFPSSLHNNHISSKSKFPSLLFTNYPLNLPQLSLSSSRSHSPRPVSCSSSFGPGPGEDDSRTVLDAFFLGKALGEALTERVESVVGELLSTVGRLQAEQQKQIQDFQEDVLERAKTAKEKAAREALEAQGRLTPSSITGNVDVTKAASSSVVSPGYGSLNSPASAVSLKVNGPASRVEDEERTDQDSISSIPIDD